MNNFRKISVMLISALMIASAFTGCSDDEEYYAEYDSSVYDQMCGAEDFKFEVMEEKSANHPPMRALGDHKLIRGTMLDGTLLGDEFYFYRNTLNDLEKEAYDLMRAGMLNNQPFIYLPAGLKVDQAEKIYQCVLYDGPDLFWANPASDVYHSKKDPDMATAIFMARERVISDDIKATTKEVDKAIEKALADMWSMDKDIDKVKYAHDYLVRNNKYVAGDNWNQSAYSALVKGETVCAGYSKGLQYMLNKVGIPCTYLVAPGHAWNLIKLDGEYYEMDVTWDDPYQPGKDLLSYSHFNLTTGEMSKRDHHGREEISKRVPMADGTKYAFNNIYDINKDFDTDFNSYNGVKPEFNYNDQDADNKKWWEGQNGWWNAIRINGGDYVQLTKSDWDQPYPGIYKYRDDQYSRTIYYYEKENKHYCTYDSQKYPFTLDTETGVMIPLRVTIDQLPQPQTWEEWEQEKNKPETTTTEEQPSDPTVGPGGVHLPPTETETEPVQTTVVPETTPVETQPVETQPVETKPAETEVVTTAPQNQNGWWNIIVKSWKISDWTKIEEGLWKIHHDGATYYWKESEKAFYAEMDDYKGSYFYASYDSAGWEDANGRTPFGNKPAETTAATTTATTTVVTTTTEPPYNPDDYYDPGDYDNNDYDTNDYDNNDYDYDYGDDYDIFW